MSKDTTSEGTTFNDVFMFMIAVPLVLLWVGFAGFVIHSGLGDSAVLENIERSNPWNEPVSRKRLIYLLFFNSSTFPIFIELQLDARSISFNLLYRLNLRKEQ